MGHDDAIVLKVSDGHDYRVSVQRLRSYYDVRRIARYLAELPHITGRVVADFITAACNAVGLELPRR